MLRGANVFAGYLAEGESGPELRPGDKLRHGWLDTGDLAGIEADGFIRLAGRAKDLIIRGGHNIDPATIEDALLAHPEVTAAAAAGAAAPRGQQAAREALAGTSVCDHVSAVLVDGSVEIHVPQSLAGDEIGNALSQFARSWKFTS